MLDKHRFVAAVALTLLAAVVACGVSLVGQNASEEDSGSTPPPGAGDGGPTPDGASSSSGGDGSATGDGPPLSTACSLDGGAGGAQGQLCVGQCVDTTRDRSHCGGCNIACPAVSACEGTCVTVASALVAFRVDLPCTSTGTTTCPCAPDIVTKQAALTGTAGKTYELVLRLRGVVEQTSFTGATPGGATGQNASFFIRGGTSTGGNFNIWGLKTADPVTTSFLNSGVAGNTFSDAIDYIGTIRAKAASTVVLDVNPVNGTMVRNRDVAGNAHVIANVPPAPLAFDGQFIQIDVQTVNLQ